MGEGLKGLINRDLKIFFSRFLPYFKDYKLKFFYAVIGMVMAAVGTSATAYMIKPVLDEIFINKNQELLYIVPFGLVIVYAVKGFGKYIQVYYTSYIGQDIIKKIRYQMMTKILGFEISYFYSRRSGELISRTVNDIERVRGVVAHMIPTFLRESLTIVVLLGYVLYLNPKLAIISLVFLPLSFKPLAILANKMKHISLSSQEKLSDLTSRLSEIFANIEMIQASRSEKHELKSFSKDNEEIFRLNVKATKTNELTSPLMETIGALAAALIIFVGGREVIDGHMSVGSFFSFLTALFMLYTPIKSVSKLYNQIQDAIAASERIYSILNRDTDILCGSKKVETKIEKITFENVYLDYNSEPFLEDISLEVNSGEKIALIGESGGGKSSIINLVLRFFDTKQGSVKLNGVDIKEFDLDSLRNRIAIVTQRVYMLHDSIANNVAYGLDIDESKVIEALKKANAWEFVSKLEEGIYTYLNEYGTNLSGGQRQRIAIARAIYRSPDIFIFDEATSALDSDSEQKIIDTINTISEDKITFIIAHKLSVIENVDQIVVLKNGKVVCKGNKSKLINNCKEFIKLNSKNR
jgi:subfamily B ATP-binding cassette protein MsbA